ncbi:class I adenylate-forming enzyme family protein [Prescottella agglutinans]|uniref:Acyl-CoA synthetase (AMP-forming)/AMP-acid ligase II n=1 Tax=Prescottella agglutinans TaxID=1644129 RepID=A0ABT6MA75_9NOCA|nr:class I adenylate-forming enzyme family protein [Prescottella agglutinans]MDH6280844.1 acyl-CoA synthetase (AMP-forming)/AMP-acid ligase II [Prescottella agglutinans]
MSEVFTAPGVSDSNPRRAVLCHPEDKIRDYVARGWWRETTLLDAFDHWVRARPDHDAVSDPTNLPDLTGRAAETLTWKAMSARVEQLAARYYEGGIRQGDVVVVQLPNSIALVATYLALWRLGAVVSPVPVAYRQHELSNICRVTAAKAVVTVTRLLDRDLAADALALAEPADGVESVFVFGPDPDPRAVPMDLAASSVAVEEARRYLDGVVLTIGDRITICWTSGTEAAPKGVPRCHADWFASAQAAQDGLETDESSVILNPFPMVNMAGFAAAFLPWLVGGGHLVQHQPLDLAVFLAQIARHRVTHTSMPPAILAMLLQQDALRESVDLSSLQRVGSGGAPLPPSVVRRWQEEFGIEVLNFFGSNEGVCLLGAPADIPDPTVRAMHLPNYGAPDREWATRVAKMTSVRLVDPVTGADVHAVGERGELRLKGPSVFGGYLEGTAASSPFDDQGYLCSGDVFELGGERGEYIVFVDRIKEIIIRGGMNIAPAEIEGLLLEHPGVSDVAVIGYPDEVLGEKCCAVVVPAPGSSVELTDLVNHLRERQVASFKLPERLEIVESIPRNPVGKIVRRDLREAFAPPSA